MRVEFHGVRQTLRPSAVFETQSHSLRRLASPWPAPRVRRARPLAPARETLGVEVRGIASRTLQKAEEFAAIYGIKQGFGSYEALLESSDIDAVYIALPPALHYDWARRTIEAGKHVLCEKPLAENAQLAQELMLSARLF